jgi:hypothetical protein
VEFSRCGDSSVGEQHLWWLALHSDEQCFGLNGQGFPPKIDAPCSYSNSNQFFCLVGEEWDETREHHQFFNSHQHQKVHARFLTVCQSRAK